MCGNSGRREALITFFCLEKVSISLVYSCCEAGPPVEKPELVLKKDF